MSVKTVIPTIFGVILISTSFLLVTVISSSVNPIILDDDTVVIGELSEELEGRTEPDNMESETGGLVKINGREVAISCTTARNNPGECKTFAECYPLFDMREVSEKKIGNTDSNEGSAFDELKNLYRNVAGPCSDNLLKTISNALGSQAKKENYICCPAPLNYTRINRPPRPPAPTPTPYQNQRCGRYLVEKMSPEENDTASDANSQDPGEPFPRVVNGRPARRGEFPWAVALMLNNRQFCGASLIDAQHVLTAAHCVYFMNSNDVKRVRLQIGDHNIYSTLDGPHENRGASNVYYHRTFSMKTLYDDVSVIRLSRPVSFTNYIQPICLSTNTWVYENNDATVAGWGQVSERGSQSPVLRTVNVRVWNQNACIKKYRGKSPAGISNGMLCSGGFGYDSCKGDSGGPLSINKGTVSQIGLVSWGIGCGTYPGVYTRVDSYLNWINKNRK